MTRFALCFIAAAACCVPGSAARADETPTLTPEGAPVAESIGWRVGCQAYTFNRFTFFEAIDKTAALGLQYIEAYPGQKLSADHPDVVFSHDMPSNLFPAVLERLDAAGVKLRLYGVVQLTADEAATRKIFDFAKAMGIETITAEPSPDSFDLLDTLTEEYAINVAIHNHPQPSHYWSPDAVLEAIEGHSKRIGACADTGHWIRSGIAPVEALKKLEGRVISLHVKDLGVFGVREAHDIPWGTGVGNIRGVLDELRRQYFQGVFSAEYEHNWENSLPDLALCVLNFEAMVTNILEREAKPEEATGD